MAKHEQCIGPTKSGQPCKGTPLPSKAYCFAHDPDLDNQRQSWVKQAGKAKSNKARMKKQLGDGFLDMKDIDGMLCLTLKGVLAGKIEPGVANAAATVAKTIQGIRTTTDLQERLEAIEEALDRADRRRYA
ncbi:MAG TPA: hypothetical protein VGR22_08725 [Thermomicrobiales bacterium]|nr:hypothetical protein [Thermomicrobiales bacterium]